MDSYLAIVPGLSGVAIAIIGFATASILAKRHVRLRSLDKNPTANETTLEQLEDRIRALKEKPAETLRKRPHGKTLFERMAGLSQDIDISATEGKAVNLTFGGKRTSKS